MDSLISEVDSKKKNGKRYEKKTFLFISSTYNKDFFD